jgi:plasmid stabilization system protein ParE
VHEGSLYASGAERSRHNLQLSGEKAPAAARAVKDLIERRISSLADFPLMAPATDEPGIRELTIVRYPYKVYYEIAGDAVWIVHIRDARRRPWTED